MMKELQDALTAALIANDVAEIQRLSKAIFDNTPQREADADRLAWYRRMNPGASMDSDGNIKG